jgi:hypothetical protein
VANTLAYDDTAKVTTIESFIAQDPALKDGIDILLIYYNLDLLLQYHLL